MTPAEIAETLLNGNIALARQEILMAWRQRPKAQATYTVAVMALDVVRELADMTNEPGDNTGRALRRVRNCLEGVR
jgi:hypothetical protein